MPGRRSFRRSFTPRKKRYLWSGPNSVVFGFAVTTILQDIWDPSLFPEMSDLNLTMKAIKGNIHVLDAVGAALPVEFAYYLGFFQTDNVDAVPAALTPAPITQSLNVVAKKNIFHFASGGCEPGAPWNEKIDVKVSRKIGGNQLVGLVVAARTNDVIRMSASLRILVEAA